MADVDFNAGLKQAEAEWGGREKSLSLGAQTIDIQATFTNYESDYTIIHSGKDDFFAKWSSIAISTPNEDNIIYCDGTKLVLGDLGAEYAAKSRGIYWFYRGFAIYVPETLAVEDGKYIGTNGKSIIRQLSMIRFHLGILRLMNRQVSSPFLKHIQAMASVSV